jgi:hypothetical protein
LDCWQNNESIKLTAIHIRLIYSNDNNNNNNNNNINSK